MKKFPGIIDLLRFGAEYITIRKSLLRSMLFLIGLTSGTLLVITYTGEKLAINELSRSLLFTTTNRIEAELNRFFDPVRSSMAIAREWDGRGLLTVENHQVFHDVFSPVLKVYPQLSSVHVTENGRSHMLLQLPDGMLSRIMDMDAGGNRARIIRRNEGKAVSETVEELDYDHRTREWHKNAVKNGGKNSWTEPYIFFTTGEPGITVSTMLDAGRNRVLAFDILLNDISRYTASLRIRDRGMAFILAGDGKLIGLPRHADFTTPAQFKAGLLSPIGDNTVESVRESFLSRSSRNEGDAEPFEFTAGGESWWASFRPYRLGPDTKVVIGVVIPATDFLATIRRQQLVIILVSVISLVISLFMSLALARSYSRPIEELTVENRRITGLDLSSTTIIRSSIYEVDQLSRTQVSLRSAMESFSRYVPVDVVKELIEQGDVAKIGGTIKNLTILFTDIKDFTAISETVEPGVLTRHMAEYFQIMLDILHDENATIDKFIGDSILAFWGAPLSDDRQVEKGVRAVLRCKEALEKKAGAWRQAGMPVMTTRFGLDAGPVLVGNVGAPERLSYTVLGDRVNQASRLEGLNSIYGTTALVSGDVKAGAGSDFLFRIVDRVTVKGKNLPVSVYEPVGFAGRIDESRLTTIRLYEEAFRLFQQKSFAEAAALLETIQQPDQSARILIERSRLYDARGVADDWDGVNHLSAK